MCDEAVDIAVLEQFITFIKYISKDGDPKASFLWTECVDGVQGANAEKLTELTLKILDRCKLPIADMKTMTSDGAAVMMGKKSGLAARLRIYQPLLLNFHCVCHKLALASVKSSDNLKFIKETEDLLLQCWKFFEYSPKRTSVLVEIQNNLRAMNLNTNSRNILKKKIRKACKTRWLSIDNSVQSALENFEAMIRTFDQLQADALAAGLHKKVGNAKFLGALYILSDVLPILSILSKTFQAGTLNFSRIRPAITIAIQKLEALECPIEKLKTNIINSKYTDINIDTLNVNTEIILKNLFKNYVSALKQNINDRFSDSLGILENFFIFDPVNVPEGVSNENSEINNYGVNEIDKIGSHFFQSDSQEVKEGKLCKLKAEWGNFKYELQSFKKNISEKQKNETGLEWAMKKLLKNMESYSYHYPMIMPIVTTIMSAPLSNAWPERGVSALKRVKTRLRNRIHQDMLNALLHITINGPPLGSEASKTVIKKATTQYLSVKRNGIPQALAPNKECNNNIIIPKVDQCDQCVGTESLQEHLPETPDPVDPVDQEFQANALVGAKRMFLLNEIDSSDTDSDCESDCGQF